MHNLKRWKAGGLGSSVKMAYNHLLCHSYSQLAPSPAQASLEDQSAVICQSQQKGWLATIVLANLGDEDKETTKGLVGFWRATFQQWHWIERFSRENTKTVAATQDASALMYHKSLWGASY